MAKHEVTLAEHLSSLVNKKNVEDRVTAIEHKMNAIQFYFEHIQIVDKQILLTDENLDVLIRVLNNFNCK